MKCRSVRGSPYEAVCMGQSIWEYMDRDSQKLIGRFLCHVNQSHNNDYYVLVYHQCNSYNKFSNNGLIISKP